MNNWKRPAPKVIERKLAEEVREIPKAEDKHVPQLEQGNSNV